MGGRLPDGRSRSRRQQYRALAGIFKRGAALTPRPPAIARFAIPRRLRNLLRLRIAFVDPIAMNAPAAPRLACLCLLLGACLPAPAAAQGLDGSWRGTTSGTPSAVTNIGVMPPGQQVNPVDQWVGTAGSKLAQYEAEREEQTRLNKDRQTFEAQTMKRFARNPLDDQAFWQPAPLLARLAAEGKTFNP